MSRKVWPIVSILLLALVTNVTRTAAGAPGFWNAVEPQMFSFQDLGYEKDETLKGVLATRTYVVRWPDAWQVEAGNVLHLIFSHSTALHPTSSMAVDWNGTRLESVLLTAENADLATFDVAIPENLIVTGYNSLHIEFYMGIQEDFCADEDNPALWATIHSASYFDFAYQNLTPAADLSLFPLPLLDNSSLVENKVTFVTSDNPTPAELSAVAVISARLGQLAGWRTVSVDVLPEPGKIDDLKGYGDLIFVGRPDRLKLLTPLAFPLDGAEDIQTLQGKAIPTSAGVIWERVSPVDPAAVAIVVTGSNDEAVLLAARALASTSTYARFTGPMGVVLDVPESSNLPVLMPGTFTLEQLGYTDISGEGSREQTINYALRLPGGWQNQSDVVFDLHFGHSEILDDNRSSLTIKINDVPVGSLALTPANASDAEATFNIPARLFKAGTNQLTIVGNLNLPAAYIEDAYCLDKDYRDAWLVVYADSQMNLPGGSSGFFATLDDFPTAFIGAADLTELAFVVPANPSIEIAKATALIAAGLGQSAEGASLYPHVIDSQALFAMAQPYQHLILVGRPTKNAAITQINGLLPLPFTAGTDEIAESEAIAQTVSLAGATGYIQIFTGETGTPGLAVTGDSDQGVLWAAQALGDPALRADLSGDLAVLDGEASVISIETRSRLSPVYADQFVQTQAAGVTWKLTSWVVAIAAAIFLIAIVILLVYVVRDYRKAKKARMGYESQSA